MQAAIVLRDLVRHSLLTGRLDDAARVRQVMATVTTVDLLRVLLDLDPGAFGPAGG